MACGGHAEPSLWSCTCNSHGSSSSDRSYYTTAEVQSSWTIRASQFDAIETDINLERSRHGLGAIDITTGIGNTIDAVDFNTMASGLNDVFTNPSTGGINIGSLITAAKVNELVTNLKASGAVCICNCNYCACDCNYCTCDCDYACTCDCNYSDKRLKRNIIFEYVENGLKVYSYNYVWDDKKHYGVMAQEILETEYKNAVQKDINGFYMVNYSKLPIKIKG